MKRREDRNIAGRVRTAFETALVLVTLIVAHDVRNELAPIRAYFRQMLSWKALVTIAGTTLIAYWAFRGFDNRQPPRPPGR